MCGYGSFVATHASEKTPCGLSANRLDSGAGAPDTMTAVIKLTAVEEKCLRIRGVSSYEHPLDTHIYSDYTAFCFEVLDLDFITEQKVPLAFSSLKF
jgi:hypothetical protein